MHTFKGWTDRGLRGEMSIDLENLSLSQLEATANTLDFETGDKERNKAMQDYFQFEHHPQASFVMTECKALKLQPKGGYHASLLGILEIAGIRRQLPLTCTITSRDKRLDLDLTFKWSFKAYGLKAPCLLFLNVRDIVDIKVHLEFINKA